MKKVAVFLFVPLLVAAFTLLVIEGFASIASWKQADRSIVYGVYVALRGASKSGRVEPARLFGCKSRPDRES